MKSPRQKLTIQEIASSENVSDDTVRRWIATGQLPAYTYPGAGKDVITRIDPEDFERFKETNRKPVIVDSKVRGFSAVRGRR